MVERAAGLALEDYLRAQERWLNPKQASDSFLKNGWAAVWVVRNIGLAGDIPQSAGGHGRLSMRPQSPETMAVYVDNMRARYGRLTMCHMLADTDAELHAMAARIGVARRWWQSPERTSGSHYDICLSKRSLAVAAWVIEITYRQTAIMNRRGRLTGTLGTPEEALKWFHEQGAARISCSENVSYPEHSGLDVQDTIHFLNGDGHEPD